MRITESIKAAFVAYRMARSFAIGGPLSPEEKFRAGNIPWDIDARLSEVLGSAISQKVIDGTVSREYALGYVAGLNSKATFARGLDKNANRK